jgi:putative transposase
MARQEEYSLLEQVVQMLGQNDEKKFARLIEMVLNEAMKLERTEALKAQPYERTDDRTGYANGFKNKTVLLANGKVLLKIPQVRGGLEFYPSSIEKGIRSERALKLAMAEMYVKGVSTRKVSDIVEILCGSTISSSQVSRVSKELDEEIAGWKTESIGQIQYLVLDATYQTVRMGNKATKAALLVAFGVDYEGHRV